MSREDIEKLLGGYATGTLTPEEREALFTAALHDQPLFEALMREEPLRELLQDPVAKTRLIAALEGTPTPWYQGWLRPAALVAAVAGLAVVAVVAVVVQRRTAQPAQPVLIAQAPRIEPPVPVPSPLPQVLETKKVPARREAPPAAPLARLAKTPAPPPADFAAPLAAPQPAPPPAPATALAEQVEVAPATPAPAFAAGVAEPARLKAASQPGVGGALQLSDARALFSAAPLVIPTARADFLSAESQNRESPRAVTATVANAIMIPAPHLGVRYTVLRRQTTGSLAALAPAEELEAGAEVALRLESNDAGYLSVFKRATDGTWILLAADRVQRMAALTVPRTGGLSFGDAATLEFFVFFSRQPLGEADRVFTPRDDQKLSGSPAERATYVVSTLDNPAAQKIGFPVTVNHR
ncbi:MAG: hypothetical protein LAP40_02820 [Acidobacteriia bacterium]|nr:hypothetical protein [Terriglobia bacterium]